MANRSSNNRWIIPAVVVGLIGVILGLYQVFTTVNSEVIDGKSIPIVMGHREGCMVCHAGVTGFSASHDPQILGCSTCHLGNPLTPDKEKAHEGMVSVPGNLRRVAQTCGQGDCHRDLVEKVTGSLMASGKGMVSVDRYVFGESHSPDGPGNLSHLTDSAADTHLRQLCVTCHLGFPKNHARPIDQKSRGGGCTACHINYSKTGAMQLAVYHQTGKLPAVHPFLSAQVSDDHCFGCHSRSARISLNYHGWMETELRKKDLEDSRSYTVLQDGRVLADVQADIHQQRGMVCIDCHTARDAMGDGLSYNHQGEQVEIGCGDCHFDKPPKTVTYDQLDADSRKILKLRGDDRLTDRSFVVAAETGRPLINVTVDKAGGVHFQGKLDKGERVLNPPATACSEVEGHRRLTCQSCHTAWAPACINCHTQFEPKRKYRDHYTGEVLQGAWKEYKSLMVAAPPALGVRVDKRTRREVVDSFIPGMIITINGLRDHKPDREANPGKPFHDYQVFRRLFSPTAAHTSQSNGRSCRSCHQNSWNLGLGEGQLTYLGKKSSTDSPHYRFTPERPPNPADGLPIDAWTGFLQTRETGSATRIGSRPFNRDEQIAIITVGHCLDCHEPDKDNIEKIYNRFDWALANQSEKCR